MVSRQEWVGNLIALKLRAASVGAVVEVMPSNDSTEVDVAATARMLDDRVKLVSLTWIGASGALINPAAELGAVVPESKAYYIIDASQALGQLPIDVAMLQCHGLVACGGKFLRGPPGTGMAYVARSLLPLLRPVSFDDRSASWNNAHPRLQQSARVLESAEGSVALQLGLLEAIDSTLKADPAEIRRRLDSVATVLRGALVNTPELVLHDRGREKAALVTFSIAGISCDKVKHVLALKNISIGRHGASYTPIDREMRGVSDILRASVNLDTDDAAISRLTGAIRQMITSALQHSQR
ncbi:putative cysteine desulfurase (plasmid) [Burkholderia sp. AD24]|nr:putative cysteine desulfurase [Burkholderia sp. AD24]